MDTETDNTALYTIKKNLITNMQNRLVHHLIGTKLRCASVHRYRTPHRHRSPLCTMVQHSPVVHSAARWCTVQPGGAQCSPVPMRWFITYVRCAQCSFVLIRWCTKRFCKFVIDSVCNGVQYAIVSLAISAVCPCVCPLVSALTVKLFERHHPPSTMPKGLFIVQ